MGEVYLATDTRLGRSVALKLLPDYLNGDKLRLKRFQREALAASTLNHPNILTIHEFGEAEGRHFIAAEFIEGQTLRERLALGPMELSEVLDVGIQAAAGLAAAHRRGILHRDMKPENIMVRADGYVKILDFGLAKLTEHSSPVVGRELSSDATLDTTPGMVMGTPHYMSPEQARGEPLDQGGDIFSLGVMIYEMLAGCPPFQGDTPSHVIVAILEKEPSPLPPGRLTEGLEQTILKALRKDKTERYQTVDEFASKLMYLKQELGRGNRYRGPSGQRADGIKGNHARGSGLVPLRIERFISVLSHHERRIAIAAILGLVAFSSVLYFRKGRESKLTREPPTREMVTEAQTIINKFDNSQEVNGEISAAFKQTVQRFQEQNLLDPDDGLLDRATLVKLQELDVGARKQRERVDENYQKLVRDESLRGRTFDAGRDFSFDVNPNGVWTYGWTPGLGRYFFLFEKKQLINPPGVETWYQDFAQRCPLLRGTIGSSAFIFSDIEFPPGMLVLHPGKLYENGVLRWTSPHAARYRVEGLFQGLDRHGTTTDVHILFNSTQTLFSGDIGSYGQKIPFVLERMINAGDTIDFSVGVGLDGRFEADSTGLT
ncbi:MAG: serine/threonine-protein kinase, partial [Blastocatellia bacterium]